MCVVFSRKSIEHAQITVFVRFGDICSFCHPSGGFNDVLFSDVLHRNSGGKAIFTFFWPHCFGQIRWLNNHFKTYGEVLLDCNCFVDQLISNLLYRSCLKWEAWLFSRIDLSRDFTPFLRG